MNEREPARRSPSPATVVAGVLIVLGIALSMYLAMGFLILVGLGVFGPGILRELGWLRDHDEFQREAARRAGYLAYLVGGLTAVLTVAILCFRVANLDTPGAQWVMLVLVTMWLTWLFASLLSYWGARRMTRGVLLVFGTFWALFVAGHLDDPVALLLEGAGVVVPFFVLACTAGHWPRTTGVALLVLSLVAFGYLFDFGREFVRGPSQMLTFVMLVVPVAGCGMALVRQGEARQAEETSGA